MRIHRVHLGELPRESGVSKIRCLECAHITMRDHPKHANEGFGQCKLKAIPGQFVSYLYRRDCTNFKRADEDKILRRYAWQDQLKIYRRTEK